MATAFLFLHWPFWLRQKTPPFSLIWLLQSLFKRLRHTRKLDFNWDSCFTDDFHFTRKKKHPEVAYRSHEFFDPSLAPAFPTRASHNQYDSSRERVRKMLPRPFFRGVVLDSLVSKCSNFCSIREDFGAQPFKYVQEWRARGFFGGNLAFFRD